MSLTELTGNPRHVQLLMLISELGLITCHHGRAGRASSVVNTVFITIGTTIEQVAALFTDEYPGPALHYLLQLQQVEIVLVSSGQDGTVSV